MWIKSNEFWYNWCAIRIKLTSSGYIAERKVFDPSILWPKLALVSNLFLHGQHIWKTKLKMLVIISNQFLYARNGGPISLNRSLCNTLNTFLNLKEPIYLITFCIRWMINFSSFLAKNTCRTHTFLESIFPVFLWTF